MSGVPRRLLLAVFSLASAATGAVLIAVGIVSRSDRTVAAGKRRFHGRAFERRWIPNPAERQRHAEIVADRLELDTRQPGELSLAEAAERLGVTVGTVRRRAKRGKLEGAYRNGRLTGVILDAE
jgi:excisionase family DNA binding protein